MKDISRPGDQEAAPQGVLRRNQETRECGSAILAEFSRAGSPCHDPDNHCLVIRYSDAHYDLKKQTYPFVKLRAGSERSRMEPIAGLWPEIRSTKYEILNRNAH